MKNKGTMFSPGNVEEWLDCGNKDATIYTNERVLHRTGNFISEKSSIINSKIIPPCFIGDNVKINLSTIGPYVSIEADTSVNNSIIQNSIIQSHTDILNTKLKNSMIGNHVLLVGTDVFQEISVGDYSQIK